MGLQAGAMQQTAISFLLLEAFPLDGNEPPQVKWPIRVRKGVAVCVYKGIRATCGLQPTLVSWTRLAVPERFIGQGTGGYSFYSVPHLLPEESEAHPPNP